MRSIINHVHVLRWIALILIATEYKKRFVFGYQLCNIVWQYVCWLSMFFLKSWLLSGDIETKTLLGHFPVMFWCTLYRGLFHNLSLAYKKWSPIMQKHSSLIIALSGYCRFVIGYLFTQCRLPWCVIPLIMASARLRWFYIEYTCIRWKGVCN